MQIQCETSSMAQRCVKSALLLSHIFCASGCLPMMVVHPEFVGPRTRRYKTVFLCGLLVLRGLPSSLVPLGIPYGGLRTMICIIIIECKLSTLCHSFCQLYSSVQFSSRWCLCARKSPYVLHPITQRFPQRLPFKQFQCSSD